GRELTAARPVGPDKVRVAEPAHCRGAVNLAARPKVASGKPAKYRRASGLCALALQRLEDFLHCIHRVVPWRFIFLAPVSWRRQIARHRAPISSLLACDDASAKYALEMPSARSSRPDNCAIRAQCVTRRRLRWRRAGLPTLRYSISPGRAIS